MATEDKDKDKEHLAKIIAKYSSSNIYQRLLGLLNAFIRPKLLTPELYGLWNLLSLINNYASFSDIGSRTSMRYLIPYNHAKGDHEQNRDIMGCAYSGPLYIRLVLIAVLVAVALFSDFNLEVKSGIITMAIVVMLTWYQEYYIEELKSYQEFGLITTSNYARTTTSLVFGVPLIFLFRIYGVYLTIIISYLITIYYLRKKYTLHDRNPFKFKVFVDLVRMGFPIMIFNFYVMLLRSSDRIIVAYFLENKELGYYSFAAMVFGFLMQIPGAARDVIEPMLMKATATNTPENNLVDYFLRPLVSTAYLMPFLVGTTYFILPAVIPLILPKYMASILPGQILALGGYFFAMAYVARGTIVANKWQTKVLIFLTATLLVNIGLSVYLITIGYGINGVAAATSISFLLLFLSLLSYIRYKCNYAHAAWKKYLIGIIWPLVLMPAAIVLLKRLSIWYDDNLYLEALINLICYTVIMGLCAVIGHKKYRVLEKI